jgi:hypothetical protein
VKILDIAEFSINNLDSASLGTSPFFFANGFHPKFSMITENSGICALDDFIMELQENTGEGHQMFNTSKKASGLIL